MTDGISETFSTDELKTQNLTRRFLNQMKGGPIPMPSTQWQSKQDVGDPAVGSLDSVVPALGQQTWQLISQNNMAGFPPIPPQLKSLTHYLKIAVEHEQRDPVIAYWCRFHAVQAGLAIDKSSREAKALLFTLLDWLENKKKEYRENDAITNEQVAEAYLENYILKLFNSADGQDRAGIFNKNVVKAFYTSGLLADVLTNFNGQLSEELEKTRKYAKWKAAYIHNCLKNGEVPISGPIEDDEDELEPGPAPTVPNADQIVNYQYNQPHENYDEPTCSHPSQSSIRQGSSLKEVDETTVKGPVPLGLDEMTKAQKYCKWAGSALNFDDVPTAIVNLEKALMLLKTGRDVD